MSTTSPRSAADWAALAARVQSASRARLAAQGHLGARPVAPAPAAAAPRSLASQRNDSWRADIAASRYSVAWRVMDRVGPNHDA